MPRIVLLGPQSGSHTLDEVLRGEADAGSISSDGRLAAITAGWRDREAAPGIVDPRVAGRVTDLELYRRADLIAEQDPELALGHKATQNHLKVLRRAYNVRLGGLIDVWTRLGELREDPEVLDIERADALDAIRDLDARHIGRGVDIRASFEEAFRPLERDVVAAQRDEIRRELDEVQAVLIAGGHIASLLNRLRLFGIVELVGNRTLIAWSAGAMALARRVVLFHDSPPWGAGNAEVFDHGLGVVDGIVLFPHASARLELDDQRRTARLAKRFAPDACVLLDAGVRLDRAEEVWTASDDAHALDRAGRPRGFRTTAA